MGLNITNMVQVWLRYLLEPDLGAVMRIERASSPYPRTDGEFAAWLRGDSQRIGLVAVQQELVVGFVVYEPHWHRLDLLDFVVAPQYRRQGIGSQMVVRMVNRLDGTRRTQLGAVVREGNVDAQLFLRNQGFRCVEVLPEHYAVDGEAGYRFLRGIHDTEPVPIGTFGRETGRTLNP